MAVDAGRAKQPPRRALRAARRPRLPTRRPGGQLIPIAVGTGRTAVAATFPIGPGLRLTRGRAWIGVLGVLLVGIVALNVVTLSFAASAGKIDENIQALE